MLPAKMGEGVLGSKVGGVKPAGASFVSAAFPSAAAALMVNRDDDFEDNETLDDDDDDDDFRETSPEAKEDGANSEAWVAIAILMNWLVVFFLMGDYGELRNGKRRMKIDSLEYYVMCMVLGLEGDFLELLIRW